MAMAVGSTEITNPTHEAGLPITYVPPHPESVLFNEALYSTEGMGAFMAESRSKLRAQFDALASIQATPGARAYVQHKGAELDFLLFALPGEQLPESLVLCVGNDRSLDVNFHPEIQSGSWWHFDTNRRIDEAVGVQEATESIKAALEETKDAHIAKLRDCIATLPEYHFIASFDIAHPSLVQEQPLSQHWRQIRESQIEQQLRAMHSIAPQESISHYPEALQQWRRHVYHLDDEKMPRNMSASQKSAFDRLRQFFEAVAEEAIAYGRQYERDHPEEGEPLYPEGPWSFKYLEEGKYSGVDLVMSDGSSHFPHEMMSPERLAGTANRLHYGYDIGQPWLYITALDVLYSPQYVNGGSYQEFLDTVLTEHAHRMFAGEQERLARIAMHTNDAYMDISQLTPSGVVLSYEAYNRWSDNSRNARR